MWVLVRYNMMFKVWFLKFGTPCFESHFLYLLDVKCYTTDLTSWRLFPHLQNGDNYGNNRRALLCRPNELIHIKKLRQCLIHSEEPGNVYYH